jgi:prepilin-type processing-associated H-X9-DG protein
LVELLVVIAIIAILAAMVLPAVARTKAISGGVVCLGNLKQWGLATHLYADDYDGFLPPEGFANPGPAHTNTGWYIQLPRMLDLPRYHDMDWRTNASADVGRSVWICPSNVRRSNGKNLFHYSLNSHVDGSGSADRPTRLSSVDRAANVVWLFDSKNLPAVGGSTFVHRSVHNDGAQFLFLDGHVARFRSAAYWDARTGKAVSDNPDLVWVP